ncbi:DJ-1/PfpI family protein [Actinomadura flavalba]|uniref:GlxA family transcriptional regulator n=1 Tax=Actinomadura flavalba TaxID=1120938 RepID=UPI000373E4A7
MVCYEAAELLDVASVTTPLAMANVLGAVGRPYRVRVAAPGGGPVACGSGLTLGAHEPLEQVAGPLDTLVVSGGTGFERAADDVRLVGHVRRLARESRRVASVCTGAAVLAAAGLLDGRRATTHWRYADRIASRHPGTVVDPTPLWVRDGHVYTAAGVTSALDLTLAFIEEDHGADLARQVARHLVTYLQRPADQAQLSMFTAAPAPRDDTIRTLLDHIAAHPADDLGTEALAARAAVTVRHLTRLFTLHLGRTPGQVVRAARVEAAAHLLRSTTLPVATVAARCGFASAESLRQVFTAHKGVPPSRYRREHALGAPPRTTPA